MLPSIIAKRSDDRSEGAAGDPARDAGGRFQNRANQGGSDMPVLQQEINPTSTTKKALGNQRLLSRRDRAELRPYLERFSP
jgi:hypothetical protein